MPAPRRSQSNAMLYTVVVFVGISIIASVIAVVFYIKYEDQQANLRQAQSNFSEMASDQDWRRIASIVGEKKTRENYFAKTNDYLDQTLILLTGGPLDDTSAQEKVASAVADVNKIIVSVSGPPCQIENFDSNTTGLIRVIELLEAKLKNTTDEKAATGQKLDELHQQFKTAKDTSIETERRLKAEVDKFKQQADNITLKYNQLEQLLRQTTDQRVATLKEQRDQAVNERKTIYDEMLRTQAQLETTQDKLKQLQEQLWAIKAPPDREVAAHKPDAKVMLIDNNIVHINIGMADHVYRGLTFAVYDKSIPIPRDGKGKAEIQVFDVRQNVSAARVIYSETKRPIVADDIVANLVWDSDEKNIFTVVGEFDLNGDGGAEYDAIDRVKKMVENWGGEVSQNVSVDTDFVLLGSPPQLLRQPTVEALEIDPAAQEKYQASLERRQHYEKVRTEAQALWLPVFNTERFLYFVGYKHLSNRLDSF